MSISPLWLWVHDKTFDDVNIWLKGSKQQIIKYVQQFYSIFFEFKILHVVEPNKSQYTILS